MGQNPPAWFSGPAKKKQREENWATMPPCDGTKKAPILLREKTSPIPRGHQRAGVAPENSKNTAIAWCTKCRRDRPHRADTEGFPIEGSCRSCDFEARNAP